MGFFTQNDGFYGGIVIKLYCFPRSGNSREVKIVLAEKNIPYEKINIHAEGFNKDDATFRKASSKGMVPAIIDGDVYMSEAYLINEYLDKKYPQNPLLPKDETVRQQIREWVAVYEKKLDLQIGIYLLETHIKPENQRSPENAKKMHAEVLEALKEVDAFLKGKEYLFGSYSLADVAVTPHISVLAHFGIDLGSNYPNVTAWLWRIRARPSFAASGEPTPTEIRA